MLDGVATSRERHARRLGLRAVVVLLSLLAALAALVAFRVAIVAAVLHYALRSAGLPEARFEVEEVGLHEIDLANVAARPGLSARRVQVTFDPWRLPQNPLEQIRVVDATIELSSIPKAPGASEPASTSRFPVGLLPALELVDARVILPSATGPASIRLDSRSVREDGTLRMRLTGVIETPGGGAELRVDARREERDAVSVDARLLSIEVRRPGLRLAAGSASARFDATLSGLDLAGARGEVEAAASGVTAGGTSVGAVTAALSIAVERAGDGWLGRLSKGSLRFPDLGLELAGVSGEASAESVDLRVERLYEQTTGRRPEPASLRVHLSPTRPEGRVQAELEAAGGRARIRAAGTYDTSRAVADFEVVLPRLEFEPGGLQPGDLSPRLAPAGPASGAVAAKAHVRWSSGAGVSGSAAITADGLSLDLAPARIEGITGRVDLARLLPPRTAGLQTLRLRELNPAVPFSDVVLRWALEPTAGTEGSRLRIAHFESGFVGGRVSLDDAVLDPFRRANRLEFHFHGIDIARLFDLAGLQGVSGTGTLSGAIPVTLQGSAVAIPGGKLGAAEGELHVESRAVAELLSSGGEPVQLLLDALRNFHYQTLRLTVDKELTGEALVRLHLEGRNPDVLEGRPFRINLNLTGNLDRLTRSLAELARLSDRAVQATIRKLK